LALFIAYFDSKPDKQARAFQSYKDFKNFMPLAVVQGLTQKIDFDKLKLAV